MGYIYKIINTVNNKIYIGKTEETIERRLYEHKLCVKTGSKRSRLYSAMKHYGVDKFIADGFVGTVKRRKKIYQVLI